MSKDCTAYACKSGVMCTDREKRSSRGTIRLDFRQVVGEVVVILLDSLQINKLLLKRSEL